MMSALKGYHWPHKKDYVQDMVDGCECSTTKASKLPRNKSLRPVVADVPLELVAMDVYTYERVDYATMMDIYSGMPFVFDLPEGHSGENLAVHVDSFCSEHGRPQRLLTDRGIPEMDIPRSKTSAYHPESNGKLERFHEELGKLSRIHGCLPTKAVQYYRTDDMRNLFKSQGLVGGRVIQYDPPNRHFAVGDLVMRHIHRRQRTKADDVYRGPMKVIQKKGDRTYIVTDGPREFTVHVNDLKRYTMPASNGWRVNLQDELEILEEMEIDPDTLEAVGLDAADLLQMDWSGERIHGGVHLRETALLYEKFKRERPELLVFVVPELRCEPWLDQMEHEDAVWVQLERSADDALIDRDGNAVGRFPFNLWLVGMKPKVEG